MKRLEFLKSLVLAPLVIGEILKANPKKLLINHRKYYMATGNISNKTMIYTLTNLEGNAAKLWYDWEQFKLQQEYNNKQDTNLTNL